MASTTLPVSIEKTEHRSLTIRWDDGKRFDYPYAALRNACPCASCRERKKADENRPRGSLNILKPAETVELDILQMRPVGNYAYNIVFSDGHSSGLFTMELLRELGMALGKDSPVPPHASSSTDTPPGP